MIYADKGGWAGLGTAFWLKMLAVVVLTAASLTAQYFTLTASRRDPRQDGAGHGENRHDGDRIGRRGPDPSDRGIQRLGPAGKSARAAVTRR